MSQDRPNAPPRPAVETSRPSLREALRRARAEAAEHADVVIDLKHAEIARLELLREALAPVFADIPPEIDLFDIGLVAGDRPRLFIDMVSFVEMGRDRKLYRFLRDGRHGRAVAAESERTGPIVDVVTAYVARRLVERERLLAHDGAEPASAATATPPRSEPVARGAAPAAAKAGRVARVAAILAAFVAGGGLGAAVVLGLIVLATKGLLPGVGAG